MSHILVPPERLAEFCRKHHIVKLSFFGSVLRDDFGPQSDVDVLITFAAEAKVGLFGLAAMQRELEHMVGRRVDLISQRGLESSRNHIRRNAILQSAQVIYVA